MTRTKMRFGFYRAIPGGKPWHRGGAGVTSLRDRSQLIGSHTSRLQASCEMLRNAGIGQFQTVKTITSWDGRTSIINDRRDARPLLPALQATELLDCPVCHQERQPFWTWRMQGGRVLIAYAPERPNLPQQINIPISLEHKTNIRDLRPEEFICALYFARQIINEQISKVSEADPVAYIHLGAVGSSIVHPIMVLGASLSNVLFNSQARFDLAARYWNALNPPRDIIWEENRDIIEGGLQNFFIRKIGGNSNINHGWLVCVPFAPLAPYHVRINALQEGAFNLGRLNDDQIAQLGHAIWMSVHLLGKLTDVNGQQAINNLAINFEMIPTDQIPANPKARMHIDIIPQETRRAGMELCGLPVVANPQLAAEKLRSLIGEIRLPPIVSWSQLFELHRDRTDIQQVREVDLLGRRPISLNATFEPLTTTHWVVRTKGDIEERVPYRWRRSWHGLHTTLIVPEGWSKGFSHIDFPSEFKPSRDRCFACDDTQLAFPHYVADIKEGAPVKFVTNAFGFAGGEEIRGENYFENDVRIILGQGIEKLQFHPSHLLAFTPEHMVGLNQVDLSHARAVFRVWQTAAKKIFGKNKMNNRLVCFINLGTEAGASISHFHTQLVEAARDSWGTIEKQIAIVDAEGKLILKQGDNPYNKAKGLALLEDKLSSRDLMAEVMRDIGEQGLVLFEDDNVIVYVEDAPMFPYETVIRAKRPGANSILYLTAQERSSFAKAMDLLRQIYLKLGVEDMNVVDESAQYDNRESCWRYAVRFMPRRIDGKVKRIGALDLKGIFLVPVSPEMAAKELLRAF